jgi:asparagine synthase (glutamine-hydrolysing)
MCGIYGRWQLDGSRVDVPLIERATATLRHRGPDDEGYLLADTRSGHMRLCGGVDTDPRLQLPSIGDCADVHADLALGFRRLAILDLSPAGHQPMTSRDGRHSLVFNGEIYNYAELREELRDAGHVFQSGTDSEVILAAYREWGEDCLSRFNGMWAFAIWDRDTRVLFLARDRFGVKPLYYARPGTSFAFASEIKALVGPHGIPFRAADHAVYEYLVGGTLPSARGGRTFFEGVSALPPGHKALVSRDGLQVVSWYRLPRQAARVPARPDVAERYRELFDDAVRIRLRADVPVGSCLSGGVDSSSIVCSVNEFLRKAGTEAAAVGDRQKAFSAVYDMPGPFNERQFIDVVLDATGAEGNYVFPSAERLVTDAPRMVWHQDEPFGSTSIFAQWCVMSAVRQRGVTVLLDGQGADEALAGYRPYALFASDLLRSGRWRRGWRELGDLQAIAGAPRSRLVAHALLRQLPESARVLYRERYGDHAGFAGAAAALRPDFTPATPVRVEAPPPQSLGDHLTDQLEEYSLPNLLRYEDRNSMAFSVEARVPFVDYRLIEFAMQEAADVRIHEGWTKWPLRSAMRGRVPESILWRRDKVGFETPEDSWLHRWLEDEPEFFADGALAGRYLDLSTVRARIAEWMRNGGNSRVVWRWMNIELWLRAWSGR